MPTQGLLPDSAQLGKIRLAVGDLSRSTDFYTRVLGLVCLSRSENVAVLAAQDSSEVLIELEELPGLKPLASGSRLGLYHFALLLPCRANLASFVEHLAEENAYFGSSDHNVSEALYLVDPDGIHIEVYVDRPRRDWAYVRDEVLLTSTALNFKDLFALPHANWSDAPSGATLGHLHFYVGNLQQAHSFYCEGVGFGIAHSSFKGVLFVSAGGYHHHIGLNTWAVAATAIQKTDPRLLSWELVLEDEAQIREIERRMRELGFSNLTDPWQTRLQLTAQTRSRKLHAGT